mgnify:FL=1
MAAPQSGLVWSTIPTTKTTESLVRQCRIGGHRVHKQSIEPIRLWLIMHRSPRFSCSFYYGKLFIGEYPWYCFLDLSRGTQSVHKGDACICWPPGPIQESPFRVQSHQDHGYQRACRTPWTGNRITPWQYLFWDTNCCLNYSVHSTQGHSSVVVQKSWVLWLSTLAAA